jgi:hypothetical protein
VGTISFFVGAAHVLVLSHRRMSAPGASGWGGAPGGTPADTCSSVFPRTRKLKVDIEMALDDLERSRTGPDEATMARLTSDLAQLFANIERMQDVLGKEYNQRDMWQM